MIKLQYWNGTTWCSCGSFPNETFAWVSLGGDDFNYRTVDETGKVLTDNSTKLAVEQQAKIEKK